MSQFFTFFDAYSKQPWISDKEDDPLEKLNFLFHIGADISNLLLLYYFFIFFYVK